MGEVINLFPEWEPPYSAECLACGHKWETFAKAPKNIRCSQCGTREALMLENPQMVIAIVR